MSIREEVVTPEAATDYLDLNTNNRKLRPQTVDQHVAAMKRGEWKYNGDSIRISESGVLLDGQHRLAAIEKSGIPQKYIIVEGLPDEVFTTIDVGSKRSASQMIGMTGGKNITALASASKMCILMATVGRPIHGTHHKQPTHQNIVDYAVARKDLQDSTNHVVSNKWLSRFATPSIAAFCHYQFGNADPVKRDSFFEELSTGDISYRNSPVKVLREKLIEEKGMPNTIDRSRRIATFYRAFSAYLRGEESKLIRLPKIQDRWFKL